jgi:membrane carboxypeptidase/penicillin-binding protein
LLAVNDVIFVNVSESRIRETRNGQVQDGTRVDMRVRPTVQGAAVVLENRTGRILAMAGGFSYPVSQLNRVTQSRRQPGSSFKPVVYLTALSAGMQPDAMIDDGPITLPPIGYRQSIYRESTDYKDWWSPKNYDGGYGGTMTLRRALENSKNLATAHLLEGGIAHSAPESLDKICAVAKEGQLYPVCERYYPFILGAQPVRPLDMAVLYASIANEGFRPTPHVIESIEREGQTVYRAQPKLTALGGVDRPAAFQLRTILQGVLARGTARSIGHLSSFVGGKTGTSDDENDAWFVGFSNDVTIAVWVGYDNRRGKRTLGGGQTGGKVAVPIFEPIMQAVWQHHAPKTALRGPSPEASRNLVAMQIDLNSGERGASYYNEQRYYNGERIYMGERTASRSTGTGGFTEYFRIDSSGRMTESPRTIYRDSSYSVSGVDPWSNSPFNDPFRLFRNDRPSSPFFVTPNEDRYRDLPPSNVPNWGGPRGGPAPQQNYQWGRQQQQHRVY